MAILCAVDFSEGCRDAADAAGALARRWGEPLWLLHVVDDRFERGFGEGLEGLVRTSLGAEVQRLGAAGVDARPLFAKGRLEGVLPDLVREKQVRLVVLGAPHSEQALSGRVERVVTQTRSPLLVLRGRALVDFLQGTRALKVVLGVDRSRTTDAAIAWVSALAALGPIELVAAHGYWPGDEQRRLGVAVTPPREDLDAELEALLEREVRRRLGPLGEKATVRLRLSLGRLADPLVDLAREEAADLLVVGSHPSTRVSRLWSVSYHAVRLAPMTVAVVPAPANAIRRAPPPERILVATDFSAPAAGALSQALALLPPGGELVLFHAVPGALEPAERRALAHALAALVPVEEVPEGAKVTPVVEGANELPRAIAQAAERHDVDLICVGSHGKGALSRAVLGSVAHGVLGEARRPVLVVGRDVR